MKSSNEFKCAKYACYVSNVSMAAVSNLSPLLFVTFREMYGISYTLLGLLVVFNFVTQLCIDLIFSFFSKYFNIHKTLRVTPLIAFFGFLIYAVMPQFFPEHTYLWISVGTVIFSVSAGLCEVLLSPLVSAIPAENPEHEMSKLHSIYAWGGVGVIILGTLILRIIGTHNWFYFALFCSLIPLAGFILFSKAKLPDMSSGHGTEDSKGHSMNLGLMLCVGCIFLGGAAECTMAQWVSGFMENAIGIPKVLGDIFGVAVFSMLLGLGRTLYSKYGKNIADVMLWGMVFATVCYVAAGVFLNPVIGLVACGLTGFCVSMLWPGTLIYVGEKFPSAGVAAYALLAAGGDLGASIAPQLVGITADKVSVSSFASELAQMFSLTTEQIGMRSGILISAAFPFMGVILILCMKRYFSKR